MTHVIDRLTSALADRYRVERELGAGGMATVYLAHDIKHERDVAIKVLHPDLGAALGADRFLAEIKTTAKLQHPHILPLLDSGAADGLLYYVMPYVTGETLRARLDREQQLPIDAALRIAREAASALEHAHKQGIVHRDIKPENILLQDGAAVVADFGIALAVQSAGGARMTQTGLSLGTPQYMSPEQAMGERIIDARSDIYALGAVTYEMLAGDAPFTGSSVQAIVARIINEKPTSLRTLRDTVPAPVEQAVFTALAKLPADRYASAAEFATALTTTTDARFAAGVPPAHSRTRRVWAVAAAALVGGIGIGAAALKWNSVANAVPAASVAEPRYYQIALPDTAPFVVGVDGADKALTSLSMTDDGRTLAYVAGTPAGQRIAVVRLDRGTVTVLPGTDNGYLPTLSPDGQFVAFLADRSLKKIAIADGTVTRLATIAYVDGIVWSTDGRLYLSGIAGTSTCLSWVSDAGGAITTVHQKCEAYKTTALDAAAHRLLSYDINGVLNIIDTRTDSVTRVAVVGRGEAPIAVSGDRLLSIRDSTVYATELDVAGARLVGSSVNIMTNVRREAWGGHVHVALSREGTMVWASGGDASVAQFVWLDRNGAVRDTAVETPAIVTSFALSPDGNRIAYSSVDAAGLERLRIADIRRQVTDEIPFGGALWPRQWIRGGRALLVSASRPSPLSKPMFVDFSGATPRVDSSQVLSDESSDGTLRCMDVGPVRLARTTALDKEFVVDAQGGNWCRFAPDGTRIVYAALNGVFVASTTGNIVNSRVQIAPAGADEGRWSADGRTIFYRHANAWYSVDAPTADMRPGGAPKLIFTGPYVQAWSSWDRAPDGRFLVLQGPPRARLKTLNVMTHFTTLLDQKMKAAEENRTGKTTTR